MYSLNDFSLSYKSSLWLIIWTSKTGLEVPTIPNGYHIVSETINGKAGTGVPNTFGDSDTNIIYNIAPNVKDETYGSIVTDSGKILVPVTPLNQGAPGTKATVQMPNIPEGYKIVKVTIFPPICE